MIRNVLGSVIALIGAAAAVLSPFQHWYGNRLGRDYRIQDLFGGITGAHAAVMTSILLPFMFAALVALIGVVLRSRAVVAVAGLIVLGFTVLWMVRQGQAAGSLSVGGDGSGLRPGVAYAAAGGLLLLLGAVLMSGRPRKRGRRRRGDPEPYAAPGDDHPDTWPPTQEPGPAAQTSPWPEQERNPYTGPDPHARREDQGQFHEDQGQFREGEGQSRGPHPAQDRGEEQDTAAYPVWDKDVDRDQRDQGR
ncbi:hypothetical protein [Streptomyces sp. B1I3]|uniref:hypothetical protein n=1 Tax=Streptomyces sp. B1I3 TaxID=3042264 RepID=UPI00277F5BD1|nr:hypothetical protein [Streptomyces sp. B1I3]MDQ0794689.1 hypothetical protein [Streptomyces sp. B1I3]